MATFKDEVNFDASHWGTTVGGVEWLPQGDAFDPGCLHDQGNDFCHLFGIHDRIPYPSRYLSAQSCWPYDNPSIVASQPILFPMPVTSVPEPEVCCSWTPQRGDMSDATAYIFSNCKEKQEENMSIIEEMSSEPLSQTRMEKCELTFYQMENNLTVNGLDMCQVLNSACGATMLVNNSKLVQMNPMHCAPPGQVLNAPQYQYQFPTVSHGAPAELSEPHGSEISILGQMVPPKLAGSHPIMCPLNLASPRPPFVQAAPSLFTATYQVAPKAIESDLSYNSQPGPAVSQVAYSPKLNQTACAVYPDSKRLLTEIQSKVSVNGNPDSGTYWDSRSRKPCNCAKSQCLKFYCECFANGELCIRCNCVNCHNNMEHAYERDKAIKICLERNPHAFQPKIGNRKLGKVQGCSCKRSSCQKNYCECYEANVSCSSACKCVGCKNYDETSKKTMGTDVRCGKNQDILSHKRAPHQYDKCPLKCITSDVVEATCGCLIARAEEAEKEGYTLAQAEKMILQEFGQCLVQIIWSIFKSRTLQA